MKIKKYVKIGLIASSILILTGCNNTKYDDNNPVEKSVVSTITDLKEITASGFYQNDSLGITKEMTLPAYIGPSMALDNDEYTLLKYADKNLLFSNYGIKDRIFLLTTSSMSIDEKNSKAMSYGFSNLEHMFEYLFFYYNQKDKYELNYALKFLEEKKLIKSLDLFSKKNIDNSTTNLIRMSYANYFNFENSKEVKLDNKWGFWIDNKFISFTRNDFKPYAFILTLIDELLVNDNEEGVKLYGF